jgi:hypothetical protein
MNSENEGPFKRRPRRANVLHLEAGRGAFNGLFLPPNPLPIAPDHNYTEHRSNHCAASNKPAGDGEDDLQIIQRSDNGGFARTLPASPLTGERAASFPASDAGFPCPWPSAFVVPARSLVRSVCRSTMSQMTCCRSSVFLLLNLAKAS